MCEEDKVWVGAWVWDGQRSLDCRAWVGLDGFWGVQGTECV